MRVSRTWINTSYINNLQMALGPLRKSYGIGVPGAGGYSGYDAVSPDLVFVRNERWLSS